MTKKLLPVFSPEAQTRADIKDRRSSALAWRIGGTVAGAVIAGTLTGAVIELAADRNSAISHQIATNVLDIASAEAILFGVSLGALGAAKVIEGRANADAEALKTAQLMRAGGGFGAADVPAEFGAAPQPDPYRSN